MYTYAGLLTECAAIASDDTNDNLFGRLINQTHKHICGSRDWFFTEETHTQTSTAGQQTVTLPVNFRKLITFNVTSGGRKYTPKEVADPVTFDIINTSGTSVRSDYPNFFHLRGGSLLLYPALSSASLKLTTIFHKQIKDMIATTDYTTGTVTTLANGGTTVTGSGTTWTAAMVGRYIRITSDGEWYKITARASNTSITIEKPYQGTAISAGSEAYTIGELPIVPEAYQDLLWIRPVGIYYLLKGDEKKARVYLSNERRAPGMYESLYSDMIRELGSQTTQNVIDDRTSFTLVNPNYYPTNLT